MLTWSSLNELPNSEDEISVTGKRDEKAPIDYRASLLLFPSTEPFPGSRGSYSPFNCPPAGAEAPQLYNAPQGMMPVRPKLVIDDESFDLDDEMTIPELGAPLSSPVEGRSRKSSNSASHNSSFRRKLSGCFRKQDSNEYPMLQSAGTPTSISDLAFEDEPRENAKKSSWYRKAASKISRHRSVSEERPSASTGRVQYEERQKQHENPYRMSVHALDPRSVSSNCIYGAHGGNVRASSFLTASPFSANPATSIVASDSNLTDITRHTLATTAAHLRASYHGKPNAAHLQQPLGEVIGSAESLVGRVLVEQGLGKYVDPLVLRATQRELAETLNMTEEGEQLWK